MKTIDQYTIQQIAKACIGIEVSDTWLITGFYKPTSSEQINVEYIKNIKSGSKKLNEEGCGCITMSDFIKEINPWVKKEYRDTIEKHLDTYYKTHALGEDSPAENIKTAEDPPTQKSKTRFELLDL